MTSISIKFSPKSPALVWDPNDIETNPYRPENFIIPTLVTEQRIVNPESIRQLEQSVHAIVEEQDISDADLEMFEGYERTAKGILGLDKDERVEDFF